MKKLALITLTTGMLFSMSTMAEVQFTWTSANSKDVNTTTGKVPPGSFKGGYNGSAESVSDDSLYVCRGNHKNSIHPGKLWKSNCLIPWGGSEILLDKFEVMTTKPGNLQLKWVAPYAANMPVQGGYNDMVEGFGGYPQPICRAPYKGGVHPGKLWKGSCLIPWSGKEIIIKSGYEVLNLVGHP